MTMIDIIYTLYFRLEAMEHTIDFVTWWICRICCIYSSLFYNLKMGLIISFTSYREWRKVIGVFRCDFCVNSVNRAGFSHFAIRFYRGLLLVVKRTKCLPWRVYSEEPTMKSLPWRVFREEANGALLLFSNRFVVRHSEMYGTSCFAGHSRILWELIRTQDHVNIRYGLVKFEQIKGCYGCPCKIRINRLLCPLKLTRCRGESFTWIPKYVRRTP